MDDMTGGDGVDRQARRQAADLPAALEPGAPEPELDDASEADLHFCCICDALLSFDPEDEIDGEGPGRDICGDCNRTRNDEAMMGW
jgi:hypothetical protein